MAKKMDKLRKHAPTALAALFAASGAIHLIKPETFTGIVPRFLPAPEAMVYLSGAAELICAAGLLAGRKWAAIASVALLIAILPANIQMAADITSQHGASSWQSIIAWARIPFQIPLIWAAIQAHRAEAK